MNFCQYRKRPSVNESLSNELTSPLHTQQIHSNQFLSSSAQPFGSFQAPNAKRPARRISEMGSDSGFQKDVKPSVPAGSIIPMDERRYRCDVEGCKKAYKNTQGLRAHIRNTHNLAGSSPRLSPSEEGILSRQLPSSNLVSPLTTGLSSQAQPVTVVESDGRADEAGQEVMLENAAYANNSSNIQQRQMVQQTMSSSLGTLGPQRIQQQQQQQKSYTTSKYPCQHCPKTYKTIMNLNKHMQESHPKQVANTTVGQLISPIRSHSPRTLSGHSLSQKQLLSSPSAMSRTSSLVHPNGPSPTPMSPSASQSQQQILVSSGGHPRSPAHGSNLIVGPVPASPQHMAHVQSSNYVHGAQQQQPSQQQQYYVTTNAGQVLHQQNHPSRGYSYQQEHQYTSNSGGQQQVQPPPYSSTTSSPVQGTTIYVSQQQQQQSPIQLQQYTVSGAPSQQQVYSSSSNQSTTIIDANRIIVGRAGAQPPSVFTQQSRGGQQSGQAGVIHHRVHHSHPYTTTQPGGRQLQQQYQQRLLASSGPSQQQTSSNATTIRVSSLNPYHHTQAGGPGQPQYVQVQQQTGNSSGIPVSQQQQIGSTVQAVDVSQPSYVSQQQMPSSHIPSSFVVRTSNHSYVKQSQQQPFASSNNQQAPQRYIPASAASNPQQQSQLSSSSGMPLSSNPPSNQSRGNNSSPSTQQYSQPPVSYAPPPQYRQSMPTGQQVVLRSVSPSNSSTNGPVAGAVGGPQVRMLAASGHNYAQAPGQYGNSTQQYQSMQYSGPRAARAQSNRVVSNVVQQSDGQSYSSAPNGQQQVVRGGRAYEQGTRNYYTSGDPGGAPQGYRNSSSTFANSTPSNGPGPVEPAIAPTLQPQEPVRESYSAVVSSAPTSSASNQRE